MSLDLDNLFTYHPPFGDQAKRYETMRAVGKLLAETIMKLTPGSAEQTLAVRRVQEAVMWANASIACNEKEGKPESVDVVVLTDPLNDVKIALEIRGDELRSMEDPAQETALRMMKELCEVTGDDFERTTWIQMLHTVHLLKEDAEKYRDLSR